MPKTAGRRGAGQSELRLPRRTRKSCSMAMWWVTGSPLVLVRPAAETWCRVRIGSHVRHGVKFGGVPGGWGPILRVQLGCKGADRWSVPGPPKTRLISVRGNLRT